MEQEEEGGRLVQEEGVVEGELPSLGEEVGVVEGVGHWDAAHQVVVALAGLHLHHPCKNTEYLNTRKLFSHIIITVNVINIKT